MYHDGPLGRSEGLLTFMHRNHGLTVVVGEGVRGGGGGVRRAAVASELAAVASEVAAAGSGGV